MLLVRCLPGTFFVEIIYRIMPEMGMRTAVAHERLLILRWRFFRVSMQRLSPFMKYRGCAFFLTFKCLCGRYFFLG
jgi:hypothetical protein